MQFFLAIWKFSRTLLSANTCSFRISFNLYDVQFFLSTSFHTEMQLRVRKVIIGHVTCSGYNQARKSGENFYSFSILLWFALWHHFFVEKMMSYVIVGNLLCRCLTKLWCQIDFLKICNFFWSNHFLIRCQTKVLL